jgi:hypothetical protein
VLNTIWGDGLCMIFFFDIFELNDELTAVILTKLKSELKAVMLTSIDKMQVTIIVTVNLLGIGLA